jgi:diacylglycerol kinase family enzyme
VHSTGSRDAVTGRGLIFVNPTAGGGTDVDELIEKFEGHDIVECEPGDVGDRVRAALGADDKPAFVGIAGGDGTIRSAVEVLLDVSPSTPLLAVPTGTRNHFARDLGLEEIDDAVAAVKAGRTRSVDAVRVNDTWFINNSSVGVYPRLVAHREARESRMPKGVAAIVAAWHQLRFGRRISVGVDGTPVKAWAVFVGNDCYGESLRELTGRERMDEGVLDVRIARADRRLSRLRIVGAVLVGRVPQSPLIDRKRCTAVQLDMGHRVEVALDGEITPMESPLQYESRPGVLTVLVSGERP